MALFEPAASANPDAAPSIQKSGCPDLVERLLRRGVLAPLASSRTSATAANALSLKLANPVDDVGGAAKHHDVAAMKIKLKVVLRSLKEVCRRCHRRHTEAIYDASENHSLGTFTGSARRICPMPLPSESLRSDAMPPPASACSHTKLNAAMPGNS